MDRKDIHDTIWKKMSDRDFDRLSQFIQTSVGIKMPEVKKTMLQGRLHKRLRETGMSSFSTYIDYVFSPEGEKSELLHMIDHITTNKTDFFREPEHFDFLSGKVLPQLARKRKNGQPVRIWSAGCSTGEEPYTLSMVISEYNEKGEPLPFEILATDISQRVLQWAKLAVYPEETIAPVPEALKRKYFLKSKDPEKHTVRIVPELRSKVQFKRLNFMDKSYGNDKRFDIIFCRNVLIYFNHSDQEEIVRKLTSHLTKTGYLFLGHSECIFNREIPLQSIKPTVYCKM